MKSMMCSSFNFTDPWSYNLPPNAEYRDEVKIGDQMADLWRMTDSVGTHSEMMVTQSSCLPMNFVASNDTEIMLEVSLWNTLASVPSHVFELPSVCKMATASRSRAPREMIRSWW